MRHGRAAMARPFLSRGALESWRGFAQAPEMSRKGAFRIACALAGAASALAPVQAAACTYVLTTEELHGDPPDYREQCRAAARDPKGFVARYRAQDPSFSGEFEQVVQAMHEGSNRCRKQREMALQLADAAIGSPVTMPRTSHLVARFLHWTRNDPTSERREEILIGSWLTNTGISPGSCGTWPNYIADLPYGHSEADVLAWLLRPEYWANAVERFGDHPVRDQMILRQLIDPGSENYDLALAARLTPQRQDNREMYLPDALDIEIAEMVVDPKLGIPNYEAAAKVLRSNSIYLNSATYQDEFDRIRPLWLRIMQSRLTHTDPQVRREAAFALGVSDALSVPGAPLLDDLPDGANLVTLDAWPEGLVPLQDLRRSASRIQEAYPRRALREEKEGRVELGIVFAPDGSFQSLHVTRSAGELLDQGAIDSVQRYLRPKLDEMVLTGYGGSYVLVPLIALEYRTARVIDRMTVKTRSESATPFIVITATQPERRTRF